MTHVLEGVYVRFHFMWNEIFSIWCQFKFSISCNCLHEIPGKETHYRRISLLYFWQKRNSFRMIKCNLNTTLKWNHSKGNTKWNHAKRNICECKYKGNVLFELLMWHLTQKLALYERNKICIYQTFKLKIHKITLMKKVKRGMQTNIIYPCLCNRFDLTTIWNLKYSCQIHLSDQLKTMSTQMGYPVGLLIWVVVKINDHTVVWPILASRRRFNSFTNLPFMLSLFIKRLLFNSVIFDLFLIEIVSIFLIIWDFLHFLQYFL